MKMKAPEQLIHRNGEDKAIPSGFRYGTQIAAMTGIRLPCVKSTTTRANNTRLASVARQDTDDLVREPKHRRRQVGVPGPPSAHSPCDCSREVALPTHTQPLKRHRAGQEPGQAAPAFRYAPSRAAIRRERPSK